MTPQPELYWRPIETAPNNGDDVLITNGRNVEIGRRLEYCDANEYCFEGGFMTATHWMPLPTTPTS